MQWDHYPEQSTVDEDPSVEYRNSGQVFRKCYAEKDILFLFLQRCFLVQVFVKALLCISDKA